MSTIDFISNAAQGRVWLPDPGHIVCPDGAILGPEGGPVVGYVGKGGRRLISIGGKTMLAAWVVCEAFHGPRPEGMQAAHEDGNPLNDTPANLSWKTPRDNSIDRFRHGTMRNKLTAEDVTRIRDRYDAGEQLQPIADDYGVTKQTIWHIGHRKTWRHI